MGKESHTWEATGGLTAVDAWKEGVVAGTTRTKLFNVPDGKPHLWGIVPAGVSDGAAATGASTFWMRLKGSAKIRTTEIVLSGFGATLATSHSTPLPLTEYTDLGIQVTPGSTLEVEFAMLGADSGTAEAGVTLIFSDREPKDGWFEYIGREVLLTAVDEAGELPFQGLGSAASSPVAVPADTLDPENGGLDRIIAVAASDAAATGGAFFTIKTSESGMVFAQERIIGAHGGTHATEANGHVAARMIKELEWDVRKSNNFIAKGLMAGLDTGNAALGVSFGFKIPQK